MRNFTWISYRLIFMCCLLLASQGTVAEQKGLSRIESAEVFKGNENYAVIVGIDRYDKINPLSYAVDDAKRLGKFFSDQGYEVQLLTNNDADLERVIDRLSVVADAAANPGSKRGNIVFAFSGHGFSEAGENYLAIPSTDPNDLTGTALSVNIIKSLLESAKVRQRVMFIDACRNDPSKSISDTKQTFHADNDADGMAILYSTGGGRVSYEDSELEQGVFSHFLLKGLQGDAVTKEGLITFDSLHEQVVDEVKRHVLKRFSKSQKPYISGERSGDFVVAWGPDGADGYKPPVNPEPEPILVPEPEPILEVVHHAGEEAIKSNQAYIVSTKIKHSDPLKRVMLYYRRQGDLSYTKSDLRSSNLSGLYLVEVPASKLQAPGLEYYLEAEDQKGVVARNGSQFSPLQVAVTGAEPALLETPPVTEGGGFSMTPRRWMYVGLGALVLGVLASSGGGDGGESGNDENVTILVPDP